MNRNYFMVRAMNSQVKDFNVFFENNVVAVGWSEIDFSNFLKTDVDKIKKEVKKVYYSSKDWHPPLVGKKLNEVKRFHTIKKGDFIIIPYWNSIRLAIAKDEHIYSDKAYELDLANQIKVDYLLIKDDFKTIPRNSLSEGLQRRLRVRGSTVSDLYEFRDEIEQIFEKDNYSWTSTYKEKENDLISLLKSKLFNNIQNGTTNLTTGGIGLEHLVKELFQCENYHANVLAKTAFPEYGDADVLAVKSDKFQETKILIQVKHHSGYTDNWGLEQLKKIKELSAYEDYKFVLATSAKISDKIKENANTFDIATIDGIELIDWIFENIDNLNVGTKTKLGISSVPQIIE